MIKSPHILRGAICTIITASTIGIIWMLAACTDNTPTSTAAKKGNAHPSPIHFGDTALLTELTTKVPELSQVSLKVGAPYEKNTVVARYFNGLEIIVKAYDSETEAIAGQDYDAMGISVGPDKSEIIQGVKVYEYERYGGLYFQVGSSTFRFVTRGGGNAAVQLLLVKVASTLIADLARTAKP